VNDDQLCELEALRSIYPTELDVEQEESPIRLSIQLGLGENDSEDEDELQSCTISFELPSAYPEVVPEIELTTENSDLQDDVENILTKLNQLALENIGLPMVYTLASAAQEELNRITELMQQRRIEEENRKKLEEEESERRIFEGTKVTVENFLAWKTRFDEEMGRVKAQVVDPSMRRLTGKEQFLKDASLCTSDIRLIEESGEELKIDESLYDDADLGDEMLSDEDESEGRN